MDGTEWNRMEHSSCCELQPWWPWYDDILTTSATATSLCHHYESRCLAGYLSETSAPVIELLPSRSCWAADVPNLPQPKSLIVVLIWKWMHHLLILIVNAVHLFSRLAFLLPCRNEIVKALLYRLAINTF